MGPVYYNSPLILELLTLTRLEIFLLARYGDSKVPEMSAVNETNFIP